MQRALVERAQAGDHDAFSILVRTSYPRLHGAARLILRDSERAQDAVQEALVQAWKHVRALRDADAWDAWLHRLTVHACYRMARQVKRRDQVELHVMPDLDSAGSFDMSMSLAERERMGQELGRLSIDQRTVMVLHFYVDLPLADVANVLQIPIGTAKSRLHRGLETLREALSAEPGHVNHTRERSA